MDRYSHILGKTPEKDTPFIKGELISSTTEVMKKISVIRTWEDGDRISYKKITLERSPKDSTCCACNKKIEAVQKRFKVFTHIPNFNSNKTYHLSCLTNNHKKWMAYLDNKDHAAEAVDKSLWQLECLEGPEKERALKMIIETASAMLGKMSLDKVRGK